MGRLREDLDWGAIRAEYVTTNVSYSMLSKKYNVAKAVIGTRASKEGWVKEREQFVANAYTRTIRDVEKKQGKRMELLYNAADEVLKVIYNTITDKDNGKKVILSDPRKLTGAIKDIKDIYMLRTSGDLEEQQARIEKLRRDAEKIDEEDGNGQTIEVVFGGEAENWAK